MEDREQPDSSPRQPARPARSRHRRGFGPAGLWMVLGGAVIVLLLVYGAGRLFDAASPGADPEPSASRDPSPGIDGVIARDVPAGQLLVGDCLNDFGGPLGTATVVTCRTPHTSQLIGLEALPEGGYPGDDRATELAEQACKAITLSPAAALSGSWNYEFSRPSRATWEAGDRGVACFLTLTEGRSSDSLLPAEGPAA
ncbi:septum formation family protein [Arthrobacter halodurans]|uniref:Septum formation family protein n=1 Tax=Arthrobacter halodurans TaxID=516699 RepID=A0ABV4UMB2_9MICC